MPKSVAWYPILFCSTLMACGDDSTPLSIDSSDISADAGEADVGQSDAEADTPAEPACGDGVEDLFESCDDGNTITEIECEYGEAFCFACNADCNESLALEGRICGDGVADAEEVCDRDDLASATCAELVPESIEGTPRCAFDCQTIETGACRVPVCGDGATEGDEVCDDGNIETETACDAGIEDCTLCSADCSEALDLVGPFCGDGNVDFGEVCDDGNTETETACEDDFGTCDVCNVDCSDALTLGDAPDGSYCGDGTIDASETCDDGADNGILGMCSPWDCGRLSAHLVAPPEFTGGEKWGYGVAMNERWIAVGARFEEPRAAIYVFERSDDGPVFSQRIESPSADSPSFGAELRVVDDEVMTACRECGTGGQFLTYRYDGAEWASSQTLAPTEATRGAGAGGIVGFSDDVAVLIAPFFSLGDDIGIPWVFERGDDGMWGPSARLQPADPLAYPSCAAAIQGDTIVLGACQHRDESSGALIVFERIEGVWTEGETIRPEALDGTLPDTLSGFGQAITFVGDDLFVAGVSRLERTDGSGQILAYERSESGWTQVAGPEVDSLGSPRGVGGPMASTTTRLAASHLRIIDGEQTPEVTFFERRDGAWVRGVRVRLPIGRVFRNALLLSAWGERLIVGSPFDDTYGEDAGVVWMY
jgi:hypothetical protein